MDKGSFGGSGCGEAQGDERLVSSGLGVRVKALAPSPEVTKMLTQYSEEWNGHTCTFLTVWETYTWRFFLSTDSGGWVCIKKMESVIPYEANKQIID